MYIIKNSKKINIISYTTLLKKTIGLMFKKEPIKDIYLFKTNAIHTFFMRQNIDICMLDKNKKVIFLKNNLKKNKIIIKKEAKYTLEMPLGYAKYFKENDILNIKNNT